MSHPLEKLLTTYLNQQEESGIPAYLVGERSVTVQSAPIALQMPRVQFQPIRQQPLSVEPQQHVQQPTAPVAIAPAPVQQPVQQVPVVQPVVQPAVQPVIPVRTHDQIRAELADLYRRGKDCSACPALAQTRTQVVFGAGNASAKIMIIGDAPGYEEDIQGKPFVNPNGGQLLTKMLSAINIDRDKETFMSNVIKCRPAGNRAPSVQECTTCLPILKRQISIIRPSILLLLGKTAGNVVLGNQLSLNELRASESNYHGIPALVTYHPEELHRNSSLKRAAWDDLQKFQMRYRELTNE